MKFFVFTTIVLLLSGCNDEAGDANRSTNDWICIPGEKAGPITSDTNLSDLNRIFGENNVTNIDYAVGEGESVEATSIYGGSNNEITILWSGASFEKPERVIFEKPGSNWKTLRGIRVGAPLSELVQINGKDFRMYGFEWDYAGTVISWNNGKLEQDHKIGEIFVIQLDQEANISNQEYQSVLGEVEILTSNRTLQQLQIKVAKMAIIFP